MIKIVMDNCKPVYWEKHQYTDYLYDGRFFIIINNGQWVGFYNLDHVISVIVKED